jgi:lipopolysaccharide biosynthesis glycosyltransferase
MSPANNLNTSTLADPIVIACAADDFFAMPLAVTIHSTLTNLERGRQVVLYVLDGGISPFNKRKILKSLQPWAIEIHWERPSSTILDRVSLSTQVIYPVANYYRLLLPYILPPSTPKVIYLDTDMVITADLGQLWDIDIGDNYVLAVQDPVGQFISNIEHLDCHKFNVSPDQKYFNAGLLVINLEQWRIHSIPEKVIEFILTHPEESVFPDQDALNIVLAGHWGELNPQWNQMHVVHQFTSWQESPYEEEIFNRVLLNPYIVHFTSRPKPWRVGCQHPQQKLFYQYLDSTAWKGWRVTPWNTTSLTLKLAIRKLYKTIRRGMSKRIVNSFKIEG